MLRRVFAVIVSVFLLAMFAVPPVYAQSASQANVAAQDFLFSPRDITVQAGTTVVWVNNGQMPHTVTADDGSFDSGTLNAGATYSHTFTAAGTYSYHCSFHGSSGGIGMAGTVTVTSNTAPSINMPGMSMPSIPSPTYTTPPVYTNPATIQTPHTMPSMVIRRHKVLRCHLIQPTAYQFRNSSHTYRYSY